MDFIDYRKAPESRPAPVEERAGESAANKYHGRRFHDYVGEQIRAAQERGAFDNLPGSGKPLQLADDFYARELAQGYRLLKSNGYAPFEIELAREIHRESVRLQASMARLCQRGRELRSRRVPPFPSEKRAYNRAVENASAAYAAALRELNRQILTLNVSAPSSLHRAHYDVERLVRDFRAAAPLFESRT
jgi:DnaJ homolog subfamily C member 28